MPRRSEVKITKRTVDALSVEGVDAVYWDHALQGFGVRAYASGRKVYVVQTRGPGGSRRVTLGRHGELSADQARKQAAAVIDRIKRGEEPVPAPDPTVADLAERYLRVHVSVHCNTGSARNYRSALGNHILPTLGGMTLGAVERGDVVALHHRLRGVPHAANRAVNILSKMFSLAEAWELVPPGRNPCRSVRLYKVISRERFLTPDEYQRLGRVLRDAEKDGSVCPQAVAALRLLILTGCRRQEIVTLRWDDVDGTVQELRLRDAKTGPRMVPLTPALTKVLADIPRVAGNPWVIVGSKPGTHLPGLQDYWERIRTRAELDDVRIHDLRHSYASHALALGESLTMIGRLLGHSKVSTTARYAHLIRDSEKVAAARVGDSIGVHIAPGAAAA